MQTEFIDSLVYPVTAEHFYISFIEELSTDISGSPSTDIVAGDRVHDNLHGSVGSGVYQEIQPDVSVALFLFLDFLLGNLVVGKADRVLYGTAWRLVHKLDELVADCCRYVILYIGKGGVAIGSHCNVDVNTILGITGNSGISRTINGTVEGIVR